MTEMLKPGAVVAAHGLRGNDLAGCQISPTISAAVVGAQVAQSKQAIRAELFGDTTCTAGNITVRAAAPTLAMCRKLIAEGFDPNCALHAYRGNTLALIIRAIAEGAALSVDEGRSTFCRWKAFPSAAVSPQIARQEGSLRRAPRFRTKPWA